MVLSDEVFDIIPDEYKLSAIAYFSKISLDELWIWEFKKKYPCEYELFLSKRNNLERTQNNAGSM